MMNKNIKSLSRLFVSAAALTGLIAATPFAARASIVGITDSGTDFEHVELSGHQWVNSKEIAGNHIDDDQNGKVDDVNGWNFVEGYNRTFFREHLAEINPITFRLFELIARKQAKTDTVDDQKFWQENVLNLSKEDKAALLAHLNYYGEYAHSTHCTGIILSQAPDAKVLVSRIFPDELAPPYPRNAKPKFGVPTWGAVDQIYKLLALATNGVFDMVGSYLQENKADVANYSVGISLKLLAQSSLVLRGNKAPTAAQIAAETQRVYKQFEPKGRAWMAASPGTLFVIAAGNDGSDNDVLPTFPANIRIDNAITVAASQGADSLASFSNYGVTTVDVAAPGVAIMSTVPSLDRKGHLPLSGTSMAAPYVTGVAAHIKDINPKLNPSQIRAILMSTVDTKAWLQGKVVSGGLVNPERAYAAAQTSLLTGDLSFAVNQARRLVADQPSASNAQVATISGENRGRSGSRSDSKKDSNSTELNDWAAHLVF